MASFGSARDLSEGNRVETERGSHGTSFYDLCTHKHGLKCVHTHVSVTHTHTLNKTESIPILVRMNIVWWLEKWKKFTFLLCASHTLLPFPHALDRFLAQSEVTASIKWCAGQFPDIVHYLTRIYHLVALEQMVTTGCGGGREDREHFSWPGVCSVGTAILASGSVFGVRSCPPKSSMRTLIAHMCFHQASSRWWDKKDRTQWFQLYKNLELFSPV